MLTKKILLLLPAAALFFACKSNQSGDFNAKETIALKKDSTEAKPKIDTGFVYLTDQFADLRILRYRVQGFDQLPLQEKELLYYLSQAALAGRDIIWDQNCKYNLTVRKTLENIINTYNGDKNTPDWEKFMVYAKRVWFSNGIHHHYSSDKILPDFKPAYFTELLMHSDVSLFPYRAGENTDNFSARISPVIFDPAIASKRVSLDASKDLITSSATNFYEGVTQKEVDEYYTQKADKSKTPVMTGLNSKVVKENGKLVEKTWKVGGMYTGAIEQIVAWLEKAVKVTENPLQKDALVKLIKFYRPGNHRTKQP
ncbi:MAG: dihydrofolate reductase, partial [Bacteroidia bacterium]